MFLVSITMFILDNPAQFIKHFPIVRLLFTIVDNPLVKSEQMVSLERFPTSLKIGFDSSVLLYK